MMAKRTFFWQQGIKLPFGNFSTGQLPIFQPYKDNYVIAIIIDLELCVWKENALLNIDYA